MSNRTVIVDNNTWNNTHIAQVGKVLISDEEEGHKLATELGANYILVNFGGYAKYSNDDYAKFLWFVRIAKTVFPYVEERDYYKDGGFNVDAVSETMANCLTYKMLFYRFGEVLIYNNYPKGWDRARDKEIEVKDISFTKFREVYTSKNWLIRVYEVLKPENRERAFDEEWDRRLSGESDPEYAYETGLSSSGGNDYGFAWNPTL